MIVNGEYERRIHGSVDQPKKIFFTLTITVTTRASYESSRQQTFSNMIVYSDGDLLQTLPLDISSGVHLYWPVQI